MSKPKYYWYGFIKNRIMYPEEREHSLQATILGHAIEEATIETLKMDNGELRMQAVEDILVKKKTNYYGESLILHYNERTIKNWVNSFVNLVGKKAGY